IILIIIGMLMDDISAMMLSVPILLPVVELLGISPIHFAAIVGVNLGLGCITPPCAPLLFLASRLSNTPLGAMLKPTFLLILFIWLPMLLLVTYIPEISLFFPRLLLGI
ncbi:MAG: TRAP transporter large permease subunit, partial [Clostridiales bacterium]